MTNYIENWREEGIRFRLQLLEPRRLRHGQRLRNCTGRLQVCRLGQGVPGLGRLSLILIKIGTRSSGQCFRRLSYLPVRLWSDRVRQILLHCGLWSQQGYHSEVLWGNFPPHWWAWKKSRKQYLRSGHSKHDWNLQRGYLRSSCENNWTAQGRSRCERASQIGCHCVRHEYCPC